MTGVLIGIGLINSIMLGVNLYGFYNHSHYEREIKQIQEELSLFKGVINDCKEYLHEYDDAMREYKEKREHLKAQLQVLEAREKLCQEKENNGK